MNRPFLHLTALSLYALSCITGLGQEKNGPRELRLLPVGDMPPFRQEIRDGVRYELEPDPGSEPPQMISIPLTKKKVSYCAVGAWDIYGIFAVACYIADVSIAKSARR